MTGLARPRAGMFGFGVLARAGLLAAALLICSPMMSAASVAAGAGACFADEPAAGVGEGAGAGASAPAEESESVVMRRTIERRMLTARRSVEAFERALARLDHGDDPRDVRSDLAREVAPELSRMLSDRGNAPRGGDDRERDRDRGRGAGRAGGGEGAGVSTLPGGEGSTKSGERSSPRGFAGGPGGGADGAGGDVDVGGREPVTVEEREVIFRILFATVPPLETQLREMCELHPERCADQMVNLRDRFSSLIRDAREDSVLFDLRLEEIRVARERFLIAREIVAFERALEERRDELVAQKLEHLRRHHRDLIAEQFHLRTQIRAHELAQLDARLAELNDKKLRLLNDIESDSRNRDEIIADQESKSLQEIRRRMPSAGSSGGSGGAGQPMRRGGRGGGGGETK